jgi:putative peptidoglycan lipid II flippase
MQALPAAAPAPAASEGGRPSMRRLAATLISGALLSKVLGFVREVLMAQVVGASLIADGFRGALSAVMLPLAFLQNESVPAILIPMHQDRQQNGDAPRHLASLTIMLTGVALALMIAVELFAERWVDAIFSGFGGAGRSLTLEFVRIMALGMPASVTLNCLAAGEIALGRTRLTNLRAGLLNIAVIIAIGALLLNGPYVVLAWSFPAAFNALAFWGLWTLWREGHLSFTGVTPRSVWAAGGEFLWRLRPLLALPTAEQGQIFVERALASRLMTGAIASLDYARTLTESALLLISQPIGLAVLSRYSPRDARGQVEAIARPVLAVALPASAFLFVFAPELVRLVFFRRAARGC